MERNRHGQPATYLGDGAYAAFDGFSIVVTTSDGIRDTNTITLEPEAMAALVRFARAFGFPVTGEVIGVDELRETFEESLLRNLDIATEAKHDETGVVVRHLPLTHAQATAMLKSVAANLAQGLAGQVLR